jgi:hypothetical protein
MDQNDRERLVRIEEGVDALKAALPLITTKVEKHSIALAILKRDRFWLFTLTGAAFTLGLTALGLMWHR